MSGDIKIFRVNELEFVAGKSLEEIKPWYKNETGVDPDSDDGFDDPQEICDAMMDELKFFDDVDDMHNEDTHPDKVRTFRKQLNKLIEEGQGFPCIFAVTDC